MKKFLGPFGLLAAALVVAACGKSSQTVQVGSSTAPGSLALDPPFRIASADAATFAAQVGATASGKQLLQLTGVPTCGVDFYYLKFWTVGGAKETTQSSGALMVPTGGTGCSGPRPIVLYAHGTNTNQALNLADVTDPTNTEGALIAATFAAQGYIVVAPNYAGYDISTLGYHPFLDAAQQSGEMMDILAAARTALPKTFAAATTDNGKLFVTGYSEGGHVAMATQRALQAAGATVTAAAPLSGPYALEAFGDAIFFGSVNLGSTVFGPLLTTSYQRAYGNIYAAPTDIYSSTYATGIEMLLPSQTPIDTIFTSGLLPQTALFNSTTPTTLGGQPLPPLLVGLLAVPPVDPNNPVTALFAAGFGSPYLLLNDFRASYAVDAATHPDGAVPTPSAGVPLAATPPTQTFRLALYTNDLRNGKWAPASPTLLCGGDQDPTVFFSVNTGTMAAFWSAEVAAHLITILDVNAAPTANDPFAPIQGGFIASQAAQLAFYQSAAGGGLTLAQAEQQLVLGYHGAVAPFCAVAARSFFANF
ncbi:MAG TPA: prolyl oligopeptidase family serine peptidase [Steroidobacteraceae bacterium]|nr:prolyl oligopeptidase family serine peptidase [Steroidobacteraceae bacterium]